tara:strand:+ start:39 stop:686 length:648 start_codon:yes stop_codon:yes gene_type:complete
MKITESRLKEIIKEEVDLALNEKSYAGKVIDFLKSLAPPGEDLEISKTKKPEDSASPIDYGREISYAPSPISPEDLVIKEPPEDSSSPAPPSPAYNISDKFNLRFANTLYDSWKSKRANKSKDRDIFINDLSLFINFVAPYLPSYYVKEGFKIEKMFDRGEFVARKHEIEKAWKNVSPEDQRAINRIYTATQATQGRKNNILLHILKNITKREDK